MRLEIKALQKNYGDKLVLNIEHLMIPEGVITGIVGPNGSGKSTLMRIIAGLDKEFEGCTLYDGKPFNEEIQKNMTMVFQKPYMLRGSVFDNISYPLKLRGVEKSKLKQKMEAVIKLLQLEPIINQRANTLSGGEIQKTALARAIVFEPRLLLLDESTANIDPQSILVMENVIRYMNQNFDTTVVMVTHNIRQLQRLCSHTIFMNQGKAAQQGQTEDLLADMKDSAFGSFAAHELLI